MTRYILAGGCDRLHSEYLTQLARVIHTETDKPSILSCWFSNNDEKAIESFPEYRDHFLEYFNKGSMFTKADKENFMEQVEASDVIYFHGGHTELLMAAMSRYKDLAVAFEGKIVVGSSAGANFISKFGFSPSKSEATIGQGLVDVSVLVHYGSSGYNGKSFMSGFWKDAINTVRQAAGCNEVILLPEGTFTVIDG